MKNGRNNPPPVVKFGGKVGEELSLIEITKLFGTSSTTILEWVKNGMPSLGGGKGRAYKFDSAACLKWKVQRETDRVREQFAHHFEDGTDMSIAEAKRRKEVAGALSAELGLAKEREQVANIDDLMENFTAALVNVRAKLVSMPARLSGILSHKDDDEVSELLDDEIKDILDELSDYSHEYVEVEGDE